MAKRALFKAPPTAPTETVIAIHSLSILILLGIIRREFGHLERLFSKAVFMAFAVMTAGLCCLANKPTARAITRRLGGVSHDALTRFLSHTSWNAATLMMALFQQAVVLAGGCPAPCWLILDDVLIPKPFAKVIAGAYWDWDHVNSRNVFGQRLVVIAWTNGTMLIPVAFALWHKKKSAWLTEQKRRYRSKNELARCLIYQIKRRGLRFDYLTFDAWYAASATFNLLNRLKVTYYAAVKCNRLVWRDGQKLSCRTLAGSYRRRDFASYRRGDVRARGFLLRLDGIRHDQKLVIIKRHARNLFLNDLISEPEKTVPNANVTPTAEKESEKKVADANAGNITPVTPNEEKEPTKKKKKKVATDVDLITPDASKEEKGAVTKKKKKKEKKAADPHKYLITNDVNQTTFGVVLHYRNRWGIEVTFRDLKQHLGFCACQHRSLEAVTRYFALAMFAFVCLQYLRKDLLKQTAEPSQLSLTIGDVKTHLQSQLMIARPNPQQADPNAMSQTVLMRPMSRAYLLQRMADKTSVVIRFAALQN